MAKRKASEAGAVERALDALDEAHAAIVTLADETGITSNAENDFTSDAGDDYPQAVFQVGGDVDGGDAPEVGGLALDTRTTLELSSEVAEAIAFYLLRGVRSGEQTVELELDGRWLLGADAVEELAGALRSRRR